MKKPTLHRPMNPQPGAARKLLQGVATEMWLELIAYSELPVKEHPEAHLRSLWLLVNGVWLSLDKPEYNVERAVLSAFSDCAGRSQVRVWYYLEQTSNVNVLGATDPKDTDIPAYGTEIVGLVVHSTR